MSTTLSQVFWRDELEYIQSIDIRAPGANFNDDADCFARYCDMQANGAQKDGFGDIANQMRGSAVAALHHSRQQKELTR